jgi:hypothetical protein
VIVGVSFAQSGASYDVVGSPAKSPSRPSARPAGVTDEASVSHYFKRMTVIGMTFGDADHHVARFPT